MAREKTLIPEVVEPEEALPADLAALRRFAWLMDAWLPIPGTSKRVGLDAGIGLIPGIGDIIGGILSAWIVVGALRHRVPLLHVSRMVLNILLDVFIGEIPIAGDIFDFAFEENTINMKLLLKHRNRSRPPRSLVGMFLVVAGVMLVVLLVDVAITVAILYALIRLPYPH
ncbi:MAG TPA: DUF4112 domain-containing protein [Thermoanaerobaculia bacterium]|nr:DUF4112 domain-containing protein [Thermoanaerobaculia bacterium]